MKKKIDSFYLEYMGWIKTKNHLTLLSLEVPPPPLPIVFTMQGRICPHSESVWYTKPL